MKSQSVSTLATIFEDFQAVRSDTGHVTWTWPGVKEAPGY